MGSVRGTTGSRLQYSTQNSNADERTHPEPETAPEPLQPRGADRDVLCRPAGAGAGAGRFPRDPGEFPNRAPDDRPAAGAGREGLPPAAHAEPGAPRPGRV